MKGGEGRGGEEGRIEERRNEGEELKVEENQKEVEIGRDKQECNMLEDISRLNRWDKV